MDANIDLSLPVQARTCYEYLLQQLYFASEELQGAREQEAIRAFSAELDHLQRILKRYRR